MQEIRDYIAKTKTDPSGSYLIHLFSLQEHKHQWKSMDVGSFEEMEATAKRLYGGRTLAFQMVGSILTLHQSVVPGVLPSKVYERSTSLQSLIGFDKVVPSAIFSTWGVIDDNELDLPTPEPPIWRLLGNGLPSISLLEQLRARAKYNKIRVCRYVPNLYYVESCEMDLG